MRIAGIALVLFSLAGVHGAELLNSDFADLKSRFVGTWSFTENAQSYEATFEAVAHGHAILEGNSGFIAVYHPDGGSFPADDAVHERRESTAVARERVWRKSRIDHIRVPGHHQLEKRNGTHQPSRALF
jgi:hypothetical protein